MLDDLYDFYDDMQDYLSDEDYMYDDDFCGDHYPGDDFYEDHSDEDDFDDGHIYGQPKPQEEEKKPEKTK